MTLLRILSPIAGAASTGAAGFVDASGGVAVSSAHAALIRSRYHYRHTAGLAASSVQTNIIAPELVLVASTRFRFTGSLAGMQTAGKAILAVRTHNGTERGKEIAAGVRSDGMISIHDGGGAFGTPGVVACVADTTYVLQIRSEYAAASVNQSWRLYSGDGLTLLDSKTVGRNPSGGGAGVGFGRVGVLYSTTGTVPQFDFWDGVVANDWPDPTREYWPLELLGLGTDQGGSGAATAVDDLATSEVIDEGDLVTLGDLAKRSFTVVNPFDAAGLTIEEAGVVGVGAVPAGGDARLYLSDGAAQDRDAVTAFTAAAGTKTRLYRAPLAPDAAAWSHAKLTALELGLENMVSGADASLYALRGYAFATGVPASGGGGGGSAAAHYYASLLNG